MNAETALIVCRSRDSEGVQLLCNPAIAHTIKLPPEDKLHILPGHRINHQLIMVTAILPKSIRDIRSCVFPIPPLALKMAPDLHGKVCTICVIDEILYRYDNVLLRPVRSQGIVMVSDGYEPPPCRRNIFCRYLPASIYSLPKRERSFTMMRLTFPASISFIIS